jgi:hypothetical protein
MWSLIASL